MKNEDLYHEQKNLTDAYFEQYAKELADSEPDVSKVRHYFKFQFGKYEGKTAEEVMKLGDFKYIVWFWENIFKKNNRGVVLYADYFFAKNKMKKNGNL